MSAVASQSVNSVFTSTYANYRIVLSNLTLSTTIQAFSMRLRKAATDNTSNIYVRQQLSANAGTVGGSRGTSTSWVVGGVSSNGVNAIILDIFNPQKASQYTSAMAYFSQGAISTPEIIINSYQHDLTSSADFDGFTVFPAAGNISGTIQVFAYKE